MNLPQGVIARTDHAWGLLPWPLRLLLVVGMGLLIWSGCRAVWQVGFDWSSSRKLAQYEKRLNELESERQALLLKDAAAQARLQAAETALQEAQTRAQAAEARLATVAAQRQTAGVNYRNAQTAPTPAPDAPLPSWAERCARLAQLGKPCN